MPALVSPAGGITEQRATPPAVSVIIPTYRDMALVQRALPHLLESRGACPEVVIVNNDPSQAVGAWVARQGYAGVRVLEVGHNSGFMGAINRGIHATSGKYVLFHNADLVVEDTYLQELARFFDEHPRAGAASGKVLRWDREHDAPSRRFDTAGIALRRNRGAYDRGEGALDDGQFDVAEEVFAVSGAALFARRTALEDICCRGKYLDETLFMYKDDIDLGWRLRMRRWQCWYVPSAVAYHSRTSRGLGGRGYLGAARSYLRNERRKPRSIRVHSMKNQWILLLKNERPQAFLPDLPWIAGRELGVLGANLVTSPPVVAAAIASFLRVLPETVRNRRAVQQAALARPRDLRRWLT